MRVDLKKFIFIGPTRVKSDFFTSAQNLGVVDFIEKKKISLHHSDDVQQTLHAIRVLRRLPYVEQLEGVDHFKAKKMVHELNELWHGLDTLRKRQTDLEEKRDEVAPFGHFTLSKVREIEQDGKQFVQFFSARKGLPKGQLPHEGVMHVATGEELDYFMSVQKERRIFPKMVEVVIDRPLKEIEDELTSIGRQIEEKEIQLKEFLPYNQSFHELLVSHMNKENLVHAKGHADEQIDGQLFVVSGWVPVDELEKIYNLCKENQVYYTEVKPEKEDKVPTFLKNQGLPRVGEDLVHIYDTPSENDNDPSLWVLAFFTLFFSIIIGDAGYGLIFLLIALYFWRKFPGIKGFKRRFLVLGTTLSLGCIAWGVLSNNYFAIQLSIDNPLRKVSLMQWLVEKKVAYHMNSRDDVYEEWVKKYPQIKDQSDPFQVLSTVKEEKKGHVIYPMYSKFADQIIMELTLFIASIHICISMGRYLLRNWAMGGWILFIIGAYLYIPVHLNYTSLVQFVFGISKPVAKSVGHDLMFVGIIAAALLALIQHRFKGLLELATVIQIVSDILSYLRLYALGLAGGIMAATINEMAMGMPLVIGFVLLFFSHAFNMALGIMGGVIHGLRLNFLEWYHYSFEGGGKVFKPLRIQTKDD